MTNEKIIIVIDDEDILEIIPDYLEMRRDEMGVLQAAFAQKDFDALRDHGHKLKGSGGSFGFDRISEIGGNLESASKSQDLPTIEQEIANLQDYLDRVEVVGE
jgi:HPt (histidine-containing phosphotransfer) domain-containing protein